MKSWKILQSLYQGTSVCDRISYSVIFRRMLVKHMTEYSKEKDSVKWHISSTHVKEMSQQSVVVSIQ